MLSNPLVWLPSFRGFDIHQISSIYWFLEKIWGYADALLENKELNFTLSEEQKKHLLKQNDVPLDQCIDAEDVYQQLKQKHGL